MRMQEKCFLPFSFIPLPSISHTITLLSLSSSLHPSPLSLPLLSLSHLLFQYTSPSLSLTLQLCPLLSLLYFFIPPLLKYAPFSLSFTLESPHSSNMPPSLSPLLYNSPLLKYAPSSLPFTLHTTKPTTATL